MEIVCGSCGSEEVTRDPDAPATGAVIPLLCLDCGWKGTRMPTVSCSRCGSTDIDQTPIDNAWAYADSEEAAEDPSNAPWGYFEKTVLRCRNCHREWSVAGEFHPYVAPGDRGARARAASDADQRPVEAIWSRVRANAGKEFFTKTGRPFSYDADGSMVYPRNTNRVIRKMDFIEALRRFPVGGPGDLQDLQGPSYLYAILTDERVLPVPGNRT